jgi:dihydroorotate dehydrogenase (NAD+) catalytic subunit
MVDLSTELCGLTLDNPIIPASGTFGFGYEFAELYDINILGSLSLRGRRLTRDLATQPRELRKPPRVCLTPSDFKTPALIRL